MLKEVAAKKGFNTVGQYTGPFLVSGKQTNGIRLWSIQPPGFDIAKRNVGLVVLTKDAWAGRYGNKSDEKKKTAS
jgi:hypothetical protein